MRVDTEGFLTTYHTAWYCPDCKKMTIDAADLQTEAERNQAAFPVGAEETASQSEQKRENKKDGTALFQIRGHGLQQNGQRFDGPVQL